MQSKDRIRIQHILDEAGEACKYAEGNSFDGFVEDSKTVRAVIRSMGRIASQSYCRKNPRNDVGRKQVSKID